MTDDAAILRDHLLTVHPGANEPWFAGSGYIGVMTISQLEQLHLELVRQGEDCSGRMSAVEFRSMTGSAA